MAAAAAELEVDEEGLPGLVEEETRRLSNIALIDRPKLTSMFRTVRPKPFCRRSLRNLMVAYSSGGRRLLVEELAGRRVVSSEWLA